MIYFFYALLAPSLPLAWPLPPLDFLWLLAGVSANRWGWRLLAMVWIDVALGQPGAWWRWPLWCLWIWLALGQVERLRQPFWLVTVGALFSLLWYWWLGPAFSWLGALAVALQAAGLLWLWLPAPQRQLKSWGWHRP